MLPMAGALIESGVWLGGFAVIGGHNSTERLAN